MNRILFFIALLFSLPFFAQNNENFSTPGTHTFTVPEGVTIISVKAWGAGGGGIKDYYRAGGGGAFAGINTIEVTPGATYTVTVGKGADRGTGNNGGDSSFGNLVIAKGGKGGISGGAGGLASESYTAPSVGSSAKWSGGNGGSSIHSNNGGAGGGGAAGTLGDGFVGQNSNKNDAGSGGNGGALGGGNGGAGEGKNGVAAVSGKSPGGGGGEKGWNTVNSSGGGGNGLVVVSWYCRPVRSVLFADPKSICYNKDGIDGSNNIGGMTYSNVPVGSYFSVNVIKGLKYRIETTALDKGFIKQITLFNGNDNTLLGTVNAATTTSVAIIEAVATFTGLVHVAFGTDECIFNPHTDTLKVTYLGGSNTQDDPNIAGTNSWIGHVYDFSDTANVPPSDNDAFATYLGHFEQPMAFSPGGISSFSQNYGGGTTSCFPFTAGGTPQSFYTETFAVRYKMRTTPEKYPAGCYVLSVTGDDGVRVKIDGNLVFSEWIQESATPYHNILVYLNGNSLIEFDYYEKNGDNVTELSLQPANSDFNTLITTGPITRAANASTFINGSPLTYLDNFPNPTVQIRWESSPDKITWTDILGATSEDYTVPGTLPSVETTMYYRRSVKGLSGASATQCEYVTEPLQITTSPKITVVTGVTLCQGSVSAALKAETSCSLITASRTTTSTTTGKSNHTSYDDSTNTHINITVPALPVGAVVVSTITTITYTSVSPSLRSELRVEVTQPGGNKVTDLQPSFDETAGVHSDRAFGSWGTSNPVGNWLFRFREMHNDTQVNPDATIANIKITVVYNVPGTTDWFTGPTGGNKIGSGASFNPVGVTNSGLPNTNVAGTYSFYVACSSEAIPRTKVDYVITPKPAITNITRTVCSGAAFEATPVNTTNGVVPTGTKYTWVEPVTNGITGTAAGNNALAIGGTLNNTTNAPINVVYNVTPTSDGCAGTVFKVTVTVNPKPAVPPIEPSNNPTCSGFTAQWAYTTNATGFLIDVATDASFTNLVPAYTNFAINSTATQLVLTGLNSGTTYHYRVRATNACGTSANSAPMSYATTGSALAAPIANMPNALENCNQANLRWSSVSNATDYYYDLARDEGFTNFVPGFNNARVGNNSNSNYLNNLPAGRLYYRVRATSACGGVSVNSNTVTFVVGSIGGTISGNQSICTGSTPANLVLSGHTSTILGWEKSENASFTPSTLIANTAALATLPGSAIGNLTTTTYFRARIDNSSCADTYSTTAVITVNSIPTATTVRPITFVSFNEIQNTTSATSTSAHEDFTASVAPANVVRGNRFALNVKGHTGGNNTHFFRVYIDWNQDGDFSEVGEYFNIGTIRNSNGTEDNKLASVYFQIPITAALGLTKMRIVSNLEAYSSTNGCIDSNIGQAEDYLIRILDTCSGTPTPGATIVSSNPVCPNMPFTLNISNPAPNGIQYQWESSLDGSTWSNATAKPAAFFETNFETIPAEGNVYGTDASITGGELILTPAVNSRYGGYKIQKTLATAGLPSVNAFTAKFKYRANGGTGGDGISLSYGASLANDAGQGEEGEGSGLRLCLDTYDNDAATSGNRIRIYYGNKFVFQNAIGAFPLRSPAYRQVVMSVDDSGHLTLSIAGTTIVSGLLLPNYTSADKSDWNFKFSARTGVYNDKQSIDDIDIDYLDVATSNTTLTTQQSVPTHYRIKATCANGGGVGYATSVLVTLDPLTALVGTITQPTCLLTKGSVGLSGLPSSGAWTILVTPTTQGLTGVTGTGTTTTIRGLTADTSYTFTVFNGACASIPTSAVVINASPTIATWDGSAWSGTASTTSLPDLSQPLLFTGNYTSSEDINGCSCTVDSRATLTIKSGHTLTVTNAVTTHGRLIFENTASLWQTTDAENIGNIEYKRTSSPMNDLDFTYWASPVALQNIVALSPNTLSDKYFKWDPDFGWKQYHDEMFPGVGYIIRTPKAGTWPNDEEVKFPYAQPVTFKGVPNNGNYSFAVGADEFNLVGNPYPSALNADVFINVNKLLIYGALYFWTHNTPIKQDGSHYVYNSGDYATYTLTGGAGTDKAKNPGLNNSIPLGKIAAGQSFFVGNQDKAGTFVFNNSMRIAGNNAQFFSLTNTQKTTVEKNRIWLNLTNSGGAFKQLLVGYLTGATNDWDDLYDGLAFDGQKFIDFYSINQKDHLTIQGRALPFEKTDEVPLGYRIHFTKKEEFFPLIASTFEISIDSRDGKLATHEIWLEDKKNNILHDLTKGSYTFSTIKTTKEEDIIENDRFVLKYFNKTLGTNDNEMTNKKVVVSIKNKVIKVTSTAEAIRKIEIFDTLGRLIYTKSKIDKQEWLIPNLSSSEQTLVVKTTLVNGATSNKKIIY